MPTAFARIDDDLYLHGAVGNFALRALTSGIEACITFTLVDGLVLARAAFHHSMNYRSVMAFGRPQPVIDEAGKEKAVMAILEHLVPGRTADTRPPTSEELRATLVVRFPLDEASAKVRTGPPGGPGAPPLGRGDPVVPRTGSGGSGWAGSEASAEVLTTEEASRTIRRFPAGRDGMHTGGLVLS